MSLWAKLPCDMIADPRVLQAGVEAFGLWARGIAYAKQQLTDGLVPRSALAWVGIGMEPDRLRAAVEALVAAGLWQRTAKGFRVPPQEWARWQTTREEVEAVREQRAAIARKAAGVRWKPKRSVPPPRPVPVDASAERASDDACIDACMDACMADASMHAGVDAQRQRTETEPETEEGKTSSSCPERPPDAVRTDAAPRSGKDGPAMDFPAKGRTFVLTQGKLAEYARTFAEGDEQAVARELRVARQWLVDNPARRKSSGGMPAFLTRWLARANDRGRGAFAHAAATPARAAPAAAAGGAFFTADMDFAGCRL